LGVGGEHTPVPGSHVPGSLHTSLEVHATEGVPTQEPPWQAYVSHLLDPVQLAPSFRCVCAEHIPVLGLQVPATWHESVAGGQPTGLDPVQTPA